MQSVQVAVSTAMGRELLLYCSFNAHSIWWEREHLQDLGVDGTITLSMTLNTLVGGGGVVAENRHNRRTLINKNIKINHEP